MKYLSILSVFLISFAVINRVEAQAPTRWVDGSMPLLLEDFLNEWPSGFCYTMKTPPANPTPGCISKEEISCFTNAAINSSLTTTPLGTRQFFLIYLKQLIANGLVSLIDPTKPAKIIYFPDNLDFTKLTAMEGCYDLGDADLDHRVAFSELVYVLGLYPSTSTNSGYRWSVGDANADRKVSYGELSAVFYDMNELNGDANLDGCVDFSDLSILAANFNRQDGSFQTGDFNRDNKVDIADLNILSRNYNKCRTPSTRTFLMGDFNYDGCVDPSDYDVYRASYGGAPTKLGAGADANFDGVVDASDYILYLKSLGHGCVSTPARVNQQTQQAQSQQFQQQQQGQTRQQSQQTQQSQGR